MIHAMSNDGKESGFEFKLKSLKERPHPRGGGRSDSKYLPLVRAFIESKHVLVEVAYTADIKASSVKTSVYKVIKNLIESKELDYPIDVSAAGGVLVMEKLPKPDEAQEPTQEPAQPE